MDVNPNSRRRHSAEFKAKVVAACAQPGAKLRRGRFQDYRNVVARISASVCCAVAAFIADTPNIGASDPCRGTGLIEHTASLGSSQAPTDAVHNPAGLTNQA
ncbi:hypothetical protein [Variovorax sp. E3]|uniref:hypothetical protein n=1 Tax=Variovorax sp. E3 TaxID=1914993 RepID=UPI0018DE307C|nr:hypothetical protein [Variovorax sp. E3]